MHVILEGKKSAFKIRHFFSFHGFPMCFAASSFLLDYGVASMLLYKITTQDLAQVI